MDRKEYFYQELRKHVWNVQALMNSCIVHLISRAHSHDYSKIEDVEKEAFIKYAPELNRTQYGSPEYEEIVKKAEEAASFHHKHNNHHPEHFRNGIQGMDLMGLTEMLCDWIAATKRSPGGNIFRSIDINQRKYGYSEDVKKILINTARKLMEAQPHLLEQEPYQGED